MSEHAIEVVAEYGELSLRLVCRAAKGAPCRLRPADLDVEEWSYPYDGELIDADCWAVEYIDAAGFADSVRCGANGVVAILTSVPVSVEYDEGVRVRLVEEGPTLDGLAPAD